MDERLLTTHELQEFLRLDRITIYRMVQAGRIPAMKVGGQWRFSKPAIEEWLRSQRPEQSLPAPGPVAPSEALAIAARPLEGLRVADLVAPACLEIIQGSFSEALGVGVGIADLEGEPLVPFCNARAFCIYGWTSSRFRQRCQDSWAAEANDAESTPEARTCHAGIQYVSVPVRVHSHCLGVVLAGQVLCVSPGPDLRRRLRKIARECGLNDDRLLSEADTIPVVDQDRVLVTKRLVVAVGAAISEIATQNYQIREKLAEIARIVRQ